MRLSFDTDIVDMYRVGKAAANRPLIIKLSKFETKNHILQQAKNLKGNKKWHGIGITHDLTKIEYAEEKFRECHLRFEAEKRNNWLSSDEKMLKFWKVVGGRGKRHLTLYHLSTCNNSSNNNNNCSNNSSSNNICYKRSKNNIGDVPASQTLCTMAVPRYSNKYRQFRLPNSNNNNGNNSNSNNNNNSKKRSTWVRRKFPL